MADPEAHRQQPALQQREAQRAGAEHRPAHQQRARHTVAGACQAPGCGQRQDQRRRAQHHIGQVGAAVVDPAQGEQAQRHQQQQRQAAHGAAEPGRAPGQVEHRVHVQEGAAQPQQRGEHGDLVARPGHLAPDMLHAQAFVAEEEEAGAQHVDRKPQVRRLAQRPPQRQGVDQQAEQRADDPALQQHGAGFVEPEGLGPHQPDRQDHAAGGVHHAQQLVVLARLQHQRHGECPAGHRPLAERVGIAQGPALRAAVGAQHLQFDVVERRVVDLQHPVAAAAGGHQPVQPQGHRLALRAQVASGRRCGAPAVGAGRQVVQMGAVGQAGAHPKRLPHRGLGGVRAQHQRWRRVGARPRGLRCAPGQQAGQQQPHQRLQRPPACLRAPRMPADHPRVIGRRPGG